MSTVYGSCTIFLDRHASIALDQNVNCFWSTVAPDKWDIKEIFFFLYLHENIHCGCSLEAPL